MSLFDGVFKSEAQLDNEYREHLEKLKAQQYMEVEKIKEVEQRRIDAMLQSHLQNSALNTYGSSMSGAMGSTQQAYNKAMQQKVMNQASKPVPSPRFDPNKSEAFQIPLSQAVTMWQVKHGDNWYDAHQPRPEAGMDFYTDVFYRIKKAELFESIDGWYRLKENVETPLANH